MLSLYIFKAGRKATLGPAKTVAWIYAKCSLCSPSILYRVGALLAWGTLRPTCLNLYLNIVIQWLSLLVSGAIAQRRLVEKTNSGLVHQEKNIEDFTKKVLKLFSDESLRTELGENGQPIAKQRKQSSRVSQKGFALLQTVRFRMFLCVKQVWK